jgi:hypothetical protein
MAAASPAAARGRGAVVVGSAARGRQHIPERGAGGLGKCRGCATCVRDPARGERLGGRPGCSNMPGYGSTSGAAHGTPAGRIKNSKKNCCCVTTRRRNFRSLGWLGRRRGLLAAHTFRRGVLGSGCFLQASSGLSPCLLPATHLPQAVGVLAVTLVPASWQVLAAAALAKTDPCPWSSRTGMAPALGLMMTAAHGSVFSQGIARGVCDYVLLGR